LSDYQYWVQVVDRNDGIVVAW